MGSLAVQSLSGVDGWLLSSDVVELSDAAELLGIGVGLLLLSVIAVLLL